MDFLVSLIQAVWEKGDMPAVWKHTVLVALPKSNSAALPQDFRGIALLSHCCKIIMKIILSRAKGVPLGNEQFGFRPLRSTLMAIGALKGLAEEAQRKGKNFCTLFIDIKKAYDSVDREKMFGILKLYGFGPHALAILRSVYEDQIFLRLDGRLGSPFSSGRGVRQGCLLSPLIFVIVLDWAFRQAAPHMRLLDWGHGKMWGLAYADDIVLVSSSPEDVQHNVSILEKALGAVGLEISTSKTKFLNFNRFAKDCPQTAGGVSKEGRALCGTCGRWRCGSKGHCA